jgi:hypothetical protein
MPSVTLKNIASRLTSSRSPMGRPAGPQSNARIIMMNSDPDQGILFTNLNAPGSKFYSANVTLTTE